MQLELQGVENNFETISLTQNHFINLSKTKKKLKNSYNIIAMLYLYVMPFFSHHILWRSLLRFIAIDLTQKTTPKVWS